MVLTQGEDVKADLIGQFNGFEQILQPLGGADLLTGMGIRG